MILLDRYLYRIFLSAMGVSLVTFLSLFMVIDFASKIQQFFGLEGISLVPFLLEYYGIRVPLFANYILPIVTLFAGVFSMVRLSRANEILPIVASGTSLRRTALPLLLTTVLIGGGSAAIEEFVLPNLSDRLSRTDDLLYSQKGRWNLVVYGEEGTLVEVERYDHIHLEMHQVRITQLTAAGRKSRVVTARFAKWDGARRAWKLEDGVSFPFDPQGNPVLMVNAEGRRIVRRDPIPPGGELFRSEIEPGDLQERSTFTGEFMRMKDLKARAARLPRIPAIRIQIQSRYSFPWAGLILLLLGLPFASVTTTRSYMKGLLFCFVLVLLFYAAHFLALDMGSEGRLPSLVAAWGAIVGFGAIGVALFVRMKT